MPNINTVPIPAYALNGRQTKLLEMSHGRTDQHRKVYPLLLDLINDPIMDCATAAEMRKIFISVWEAYWNNGVQGPNDDILCNKLKIEPLQTKWSRVVGISRPYGRPAIKVPTASGNYDEPDIDEYTLRGTNGRYDIKLKLFRHRVGGYEFKLPNKKFIIRVSITDTLIDSSIVRMEYSDDNIRLLSSSSSAVSFHQMTSELFGHLMESFNRELDFSKTLKHLSEVGQRYDIYR